MQLKTVISSTILLFCISNAKNQNELSWDAEKYDKNSSIQYQRGIQAVESFKLQGHEKVLDVGCRTGKISALCATVLKTGSLIAIDNSQSMIDFSQKSYGNVTNVQFILQDVTTMTFDQ